MKRINCERCSRGCAVEIIEENGKSYICGNNCGGGEQSARDKWPEIKDLEVYPKKEEKKRSFLSRIFSRS